MLAAQMFTLADAIGIITASVAGSMLAIDKKVDLFGVLLLGTISALGGGITRDVLLGTLPPVAFSSPFYIPLALGVSLLVFLLARFGRRFYQREETLIHRINNVFDAIGLGAFAVSGAAVAHAAGYGENTVLVAFVGMTTAVGGGLLRDVLLREIPFVLKKRIYAVAALVGALLYHYLVVWQAGEAVAAAAAILVVFVLRILATVFHWNFPRAID